jgi:hypothetical protein
VEEYLVGGITSGHLTWLESANRGRLNLNRT